LRFVREIKIIDNKLLVNIENPETQNPEIIRTLVEAGADVQFVGELRHSLEDVYLQLIKEN
jgi:ABC-2 type transport system ATP-binding protein